MLALLLLQVGLGGLAGLNGYPANSPVISALTQSCDSVSCVLSWTTDIASDSRGNCSTEIAADNATAALATSHQVTVAGLVPSTGYTCTVTSGSTNATISATTTALATSTPITGVSVGTATQYTGPVHCDTMYNFQSSDGTTYFICDDVASNAGFSGAQNSAVSLNKFTTIPTAASLVNAMSGYGNCCTLVAPDFLSPKGQGLIGLNGNLFMLATRQQQGQTSFDRQSDETIIESTDKGVHWNSFGALSTFTTTGANNSPLSLTQFTSTSPTNFAASSFVVNGADDGTNGALVAANRVDNANAYVYGISNNQSGTLSTWDDGDSMYLWRVPRAKLGGWPNGVQCWVSGDGSLDANWTTTFSTCGAVLTNSGKTSLLNMQYIPALNRYLLLTWYYPSGLGTSSSATWLAYDCTHPWQCNSTPVSTITSSTIGVSGAYGGTIVQADALAASFGSTTMHVLFTSDFNATYAVNYATLTVSH